MLELQGILAKAVTHTKESNGTLGHWIGEGADHKEPYAFPYMMEMFYYLDCGSSYITIHILPNS